MAWVWCGYSNCQIKVNIKADGCMFIKQVIFLNILNLVYITEQITFAQLTCSRNNDKLFTAYGARGLFYKIFISSFIFKGK